MDPKILRLIRACDSVICQWLKRHDKDEKEHWEQDMSYLVDRLAEKVADLEK